MKIVLFLLALGFSALGFSNMAHAAATGNWIGWADWYYQGQKRSAHCDASMALRETEKTFNFLKGLLDCQVVTMDIPGRSFEKIEEKLVMEGETVGQWNGGTFEWTERYNERTVIHVSIKIDGGHMDYQEHWIEDENTPLYEIKGRLFRQN